MYIRFIASMEVERKIQHSHGIVTQAKIMLDENVLYFYHAEQVEQIFVQLNNDLPCPPFDKKNWPSNAICWFRETIQKYINFMYELKYILEEYDTKVIILKRKDVGNIIYSDNHQVVSVSSKL